VSVSVAQERASNPERRFYQWMVTAVIAMIVLGFVRTFFLRPLFPAVHAPKEIYFYLHGVVFTLWLALLFTQVTLVGAGNIALHRRLGLAGFVLLPLMVLLGVIGGVIAAHRPGGFVDIATPPLEFLVVPYADLVVFSGFAIAALLLRGRPQAHKRLMLLAAIGIAEVGIARWPFEPYVSTPSAAMWTTAALVIPMIAWDFTSRGRIHPATAVGAAVLVAEGPVREAISHTGWWLAFATWATGFVSW
jgi:uncharacterized membrane protein YozB (DUF420 family)